VIDIAEGRELEEELGEIISSLKNKWIFPCPAFPSDRTVTYEGTSKEFVDIINSLSEPFVYVDKFGAAVFGYPDEEIMAMDGFKMVHCVEGLPHECHGKMYFFRVCFIHNSIYHILTRYSPWSQMVFDSIEETKEKMNGSSDASTLKECYDKLHNHKEELIQGFLGSKYGSPGAIEPSSARFQEALNDFLVAEHGFIDSSHPNRTSLDIDESMDLFEEVAELSKLASEAYLDREDKGIINLVPGCSDWASGKKIKTLKVAELDVYLRDSKIHLSKAGKKKLLMEVNLALKATC